MALLEKREAEEIDRRGKDSEDNENLINAGAGIWHSPPERSLTR
jgi:hypothetical protein